jgi:hypothetical protein
MKFGRVALGVAPQGPHGIGQADFPHPALQVNKAPNSSIWTGLRCVIHGFGRGYFFRILRNFCQFR